MLDDGILMAEQSVTYQPRGQMTCDTSSWPLLVLIGGRWLRPVLPRNMIATRAIKEYGRTNTQLYFILKVLEAGDWGSITLRERR